MHDDNLTAERPTFVTHLECGMTGERYEADQLHGLSRVGRPLLVRYDPEAAAKTLTRESLAAREGGMWKWCELLPHDGELLIQVVNLLARVEAQGDVLDHLVIGGGVALFPVGEVNAAQL